MAEVEHTSATSVPVQTLWEFVSEMDNWAAWVTGYQSHEKESEDDSVWVLKGDLGAMTRTLRFRVHIEEWAGPSRVGFRLEGLNEPVRGRGEFVIATAEGAPAPPARKSLAARMLEAIVRFLWRRPRAARREPTGTAEARMTFRLTLEPGGPMGPMIDAMVKPAMSVAAEDLAGRILGHLEGRS